MITLEKKTTEDTAQMTARLIGDALMEKIHVPTLFLTSGGSCLSVLERIDVLSLRDTITVGLLDERFSLDPSVNNFCALRRGTFYTKAVRAGIRFIDTSCDKSETVVDLSRKLNRAVREWTQVNTAGHIITLLGLGTDAHIGGMMPYPESSPNFSFLFEDDPWFVGYDAGAKIPHRLRVTATNTFLREKVSRAFLYAVGLEKKKALELVINGKGELYKYPGRIIHEMKLVQVCTDVI